MRIIMVSAELETLFLGLFVSVYEAEVNTVTMLFNVQWAGT